ncbi:MAG: hypothetical protein JF607_23840 [Burkholderiales bacterium]|jgi:hypothetical protein|nr:hypothetical protein [Burkholderiales bacterium]
MDSPDSTPDGSPDIPAATVKAIGDLDALVQAILKATPASKPWQRQLLVHLSQMDREVQVLRLTISLGRGVAEVGEAAAVLRRTLRTANLYVGGGRADMGTKAAIRLALELGQKIDGLLEL